MCRSTGPTYRHRTDVSERSRNDESSHNPARDGPNARSKRRRCRVAAATPGPTPDEGLTGACNMTNTHAAFGMFEIAVQSGPGLDGMFTAIINTGGDCID